MTFLKKISCLGLLCLGVSGCTFTKSIVWMFPDMRDQHRFAKSWVKHDDTPFDFVESGLTEYYNNRIVVPGDKYSLQTTNLDGYLKKSNAQAFMIIRNDSILYERYFKGYKAENALSSFSVAKSFLGMLTGIAFSEGKLSSREASICDYLPQLDRKQFEKVHISHLLNQTSGLRFRMSSSLYYSNDLKRTVLPKGLRCEPGTHFRYENGNSQLLAMILEQAYQQPISQLLQDKIWSKIGTRNDLFWSQDSKKHQENKAFCCMNAPARDFAKFGKLLLQRGQWNGEQIIPEAWIDDTFYKRNTAEGASARYRNQMWSENGYVAAVGMYGQYIYLCPKKHLMLIMFSSRAYTLHAFREDFFGNIIEQL